MQTLRRHKSETVSHVLVRYWTPEKYFPVHFSYLLCFFSKRTCRSFHFYQKKICKISIHRHFKAFIFVIADEKQRYIKKWTKNCCMIEEN